MPDEPERVNQKSAQRDILMKVETTPVKRGRGRPRKEASAPPAPAPMPHVADRLIRLPEVVAMLGVSRSTVLRLVDQKRLPRPAKMGARANVWRQSDVAAIIASIGRAA